jgi:hypothetical protein
MSDAKYPYYRSYLLRFWQESEGSPCRSLLHSVEDGKTLAFGSWESLIIFLLERGNPSSNLHPPLSNDPKEKE